MLRFLREHPHAPRYTAQSGHRLTPDRLARVRAFDAELRAGPHGWAHAELPPWLHDFVAMCYRDVPFYRAYGAQPASFFDVPPCERSDLKQLAGNLSANRLRQSRAPVEPGGLRVEQLRAGTRQTSGY